MTWFDSLRTLLAVVFLLVVGVPGYVQRIREQRAIAARGAEADIASHAQQSFDALKPFVPASGRIGYLQPADWPKADAVLLFYLAEYVLTPRIVVLSTDAEFVIAVPQTGAGSEAGDDPRLKNFELANRFPDGLRLFRRVR